MKTPGAIIYYKDVESLSRNEIKKRDAYVAKKLLRTTTSLSDEIATTSALAALSKATFLSLIFSILRCRLFDDFPKRNI